MEVLEAKTDEELIARAEHWRNQLPARSDEIEAGRQLPSDIARAFTDDGIFHAAVPKELGGSEVHPATVTRIIRLIAEGDGSAGWNVMIGCTTSLLSASLPEEFAESIYGGGAGVLTVGVTAPLGKAESVEGGYRVTGRWPFGSGSANADWICGGSVIHDDGAARQGKGGAPELHLMMFHRDQVEIEDTWHVAGLGGTGSHHFHVTDQFVPEGRSVLLGGRARVTRPLYQFPMLGLLALGVASVSLGIGYKALNAFRELAGAKTPTGASRLLGQRSAVQSVMGQSVADLESAEAYMASKINEAYELAQRGDRLSVETKAGLRLAAVNATQRAAQAVDRLYHAGGGTAIYAESELQRCFRDVHVSTQHIMVGMPIYEVVGRVELGLDPASLL
jgi:alkylation response protein AidB-like acyl-CoA dehydrogenase